MTDAATAVLVTGGAGYLGSHVALLLAHRGYHPVVLDNLATGHRGAARWGTFVEADLADPARVREVLLAHRIRAVIHLAGCSWAGESVRAPAKYYRGNLVPALALVEAMAEVESEHLVCSSTGAVYGETDGAPVAETAPLAPVSPYGRTRLAVEGMVEDFARAHGLRRVTLRCANLAGADPGGELGEDHDPEGHLIPLALEVAQGRRPHLAVFGTDYPTPDGTGVRDYLHVTDAAEAHLLALEHLLAGGEPRTYNLGTGVGTSVLEILEGCRRLTGHRIPALAARRRWGDPAATVLDAARLRRELGWKPRHSDLDTILDAAWRWRRARG